MKKFKKLLAVLLAVAAVCALMAVPASAAVPYKSGTTSDSGVNANCPWSTSLTIAGNTATAQIAVQSRTSGSKPVAFDASLQGMIHTSVGYDLPIEEKTRVERSDSLIVTGSRSAVGIDSIVSAYCYFSAMGSSAGYLSLGR